MEELDVEGQVTIVAGDRIRGKEKFVIVRQILLKVFVRDAVLIGR